MFRRPPKTTIPLYNIERVDQDRFRISVALAGFSPDEISLTAEQNVLTQRRASTDLKARHLTAEATLARALGGGWQGEPPAAPVLAQGAGAAASH